MLNICDFHIYYGSVVQRIESHASKLLAVYCKLNKVIFMSSKQLSKLQTTSDWLQAVSYSFHYVNPGT